MTSFLYLGRVILEADDDWLAVVRNLSRARAVWKSTTRILSREGEDMRVYGFFFKDMVHGMLLFGLETWLVTPFMGKSLGRFQDQVARRLTGRIPRRKTDAKWYYTLAATARDEAGFQTMEECIRRQ